MLERAYFRSEHISYVTYAIRTELVHASGDVTERDLTDGMYSMRQLGAKSATLCY